MGLIGDLDHGIADRQLGPRGQVRLAEVEVDDELITGQRHALRRTGELGQDPGVHDVELHVRMRSATLGA